MYFTVGTITVIIMTAWILNLKNALNLSNSAETAKDQSLNQITDNLSELITSFKNINAQFAQSAATSGQTLQGGPKISPEQLDLVAERLLLGASTTATSSTISPK